MSPEAVGPAAYGATPARSQSAATFPRRPAENDLARALSDQEAKACAEIFGLDPGGARELKPAVQPGLGRHIDVLA